MLPTFTTDGYLPPGDYELTLGELRASMLVVGPAGYPKKQLPMWHQYRVELYPHFGQLSGIRDKYGNDLEFPSAFRISRRDGRARGIVTIKKEDQP